MPTAQLIPTADELPNVLPTLRLSATGRLSGPNRAPYREIKSWRSGLAVVGAWGQITLVLGAAFWTDHPLVWVGAFLLMGRSFALLAILMHEAAHRLLFPTPRINDTIGRWLLAYPAFTSFDRYRKAHLAHHKDEMGPDEPDKRLYAGYPITKASWRRKLTRDALLISGWKNLRPLLRALRVKVARPVALRIWFAQGVIAAVLTYFGGPFAFLLLWLLPWMTVWRVTNRLRALAEHAGMTRSSDRRQTTHHVRQSWLARFWIAPYCTGWHLAHHVDIGIPYRNLPAFHKELEAAGWVTPDLTYPNYRSLWRALRSG